MYVRSHDDEGIAGQGDAAAVKGSVLLDIFVFVLPASTHRFRNAFGKFLPLG
jgi:hypothetical protein